MRRGTVQATGRSSVLEGRREARARLVRTWRGLVRQMVFGRTPWLRVPLRAMRAGDLRLLAPHLDAGFYRLQFDKPRFADMAARDPALHYLLLGHHQGLSPDPDFDPRHYRQAHRGVPSGPPYLHYLRVGRPSGLAPAPALPEPEPEAAGKPTVMILDHARGGGSTHFLDLYAEHLQAQGWRTLRTRRIGARRPLYLTPDRDGGRSVHLLTTDSGAWLEAKGVRRLVFNHLIDLPPGAFTWARELAAHLGLDYEVLLHDYYLACPRVNLVDANGRFCDLTEADCAGCLVGEARRDWREAAAALLAGAVRVTAPSSDLAGRMGRLFPEARIEVWEPETDRPPSATPPSIARGEPLRLVILGALNQPKGYDVVLRLARRIRATDAPVRLTVLGDSFGARALRREGVGVHGRYAEAQVADLLDRLAPHATFFPAIWPETWSFTLTHALRQGLFTLAFDIGAIAVRLRRLATGRLLPYALSEDASALLDALLALRAEGLTDAEP